jgi:hypothetical protein
MMTDDAYAAERAALVAVIERVRDGLRIWEGTPQNYDMQECALTTIAEAVAGAGAPEVEPKGVPERVFPEDIIYVMSETELVTVRGLKRDLAAANARVAELERRADITPAQLELGQRLIAGLTAERDAANARIAELEHYAAGADSALTDVTARCNAALARVAELAKHHELMVDAIRRNYTNALDAANARIAELERDKQALLESNRGLAGMVDAANARADAAKALFDVSDADRRREWQRAERAESEAAALRAELEDVYARNGQHAINEDRLRKRLAAATELLVQCKSLTATGDSWRLLARIDAFLANAPAAPTCVGCTRHTIWDDCPVHGGG